MEIKAKDRKSKLEVINAKLAYTEQLLNTAEKFNDSDTMDFVATAYGIVKSLAAGICNGEKERAIKEIRESMEETKDEISKIESR